MNNMNTTLLPSIFTPNDTTFVSDKGDGEVGRLCVTLKFWDQESPLAGVTLYLTQPRTKEKKMDFRVELISKMSVTTQALMERLNQAEIPYHSQPGLAHPGHADFARSSASNKSCEVVYMGDQSIRRELPPFISLKDPLYMLQEANLVPARTIEKIEEIFALIETENLLHATPERQGEIFDTLSVGARRIK